MDKFEITRRKLLIGGGAGILGGGVAARAFLIRPDIPVEELRPEYTNEDSEFMELDGMDVHYRVEGEGPPLLLLHGAFASLHTWDGWVDRLKNEFKLIRLDLPAHGLTGPRPNSDYSISGYVEFLNRFMSKLGISSFNIAGNSLGGLMSWRFALRYPEKIKKIILVSAAGYQDEEGDGETPLLFRVAMAPVLGNILTSVTPRSFIEMNLKSVYADDSKVTPELIERYQDLVRREGNRDAMLSALGSNRVDKSDEIPDIEKPTLIQWGRQDEWIPVENAERFHSDLPNSTLKIYDNVGHVAMEEIPGRTASDAEEFLNQ